MAAVRIACLVTSCALVFDAFTSDKDCNKLCTIPSRAWTSDGTLWAPGGKSSLMTGLSQTVRMTACLCRSDRRCLPRVLCTQPKIPATSRRTSLLLTPSSLPTSVSDIEPSSPTTLFAACLLLSRDWRCRSLARSRCWSLAMSSSAPASCCICSDIALPAGPSRRMPALLSCALTLPICTCTSRRSECGKKHATTKWRERDVRTLAPKPCEYT
jgi:hypothetical protein